MLPPKKLTNLPKANHKMAKRKTKTRTKKRTTNNTTRKEDIQKKKETEKE
jgi:hypothetical protein